MATAAYTRKVYPSSPEPNDPVVVTTYMIKANGKAATVPIPFRGILAHAEIVTAVALSSGDLVVTLTDGDAVTLGTLTAAESGSDVGDTANIAFDTSVTNDILTLDNEDLTLTMAGTSAGEVMIYLIFESAVGQAVV